MTAARRHVLKFVESWKNQKQTQKNNIPLCSFLFLTNSKGILYKALRSVNECSVKWSLKSLNPRCWKDVEKRVFCHFKAHIKHYDDQNVTKSWGTNWSKFFFKDVKEKLPFFLIWPNIFLALNSSFFVRN